MNDRYNDPHGDYKARKVYDLSPPRHQIDGTCRVAQVCPVQAKVQETHST